MPGGVAPKSGRSEKVSRYTGVSQLQLRVSRYTVQLCSREVPRIQVVGKRELSLKGATLMIKERKMYTNFLSTNFWNTPRGPGHPGKIPGTSQIPLFETQGRQTFEGGHEVFGHHPFAWKTPTPPGGLRTQKLNLCALFLA